MSKKKDYTIETVLSSSKEYGSGSVDGQIVLKQAPFSLRPYMARFRKGCVPYLVGSRTALDLGMRVACNAVAAACSCAVRYVLSGSGAAASTGIRMDLGTSLNMKNDIVNSPNGWTMAFWIKQPPLAASVLYSRGYLGVGSGTLSHYFFAGDGSSAGGPNAYQMYLGNLASPGTALVIGGSSGDWNLVVYQASASAGSLTGSITVVSSSGGYQTSASANPIGSGTGSTNTNNYIGAYASSEYASFAGSFTGSIADFAIWDKTLSQAEITGTLWNSGKPLCLTGSALSGNLQHWLRMGDGASDTSLSCTEFGGEGGGYVWTGGATYDQTGSLTGTVINTNLGINCGAISPSPINLVSLSESESIYVPCSGS